MEESMEERREKEAQWFAHYDRLKEYLEQNQWEPPTRESHPELYEWLVWLRESFKRTPDSSHWVWKKDLLSELGIDLFPLHIYSAWRQNFAGLQAHLETHNGERPNQTTNPRLVSWLAQQRKRYKKAEDKKEWASRVHLLTKLGIDITKSAREDKNPNLSMSQKLHPSQFGSREEPEESFNGSLHGSISGFDDNLAGMMLEYPAPAAENPVNMYPKKPEKDQASSGQVPEKSRYPGSPLLPVVTPTKSPKDAQWIAQFQRLKSFMEENNGDLPSSLGQKALYMWLHYQKKMYAKSPSEYSIWKQQMLGTMGISLSSKSGLSPKVSSKESTGTGGKWGECYQNLKDFMVAHGRPTLQTNARLYYWLIQQRKHFKRSPDKPKWQRRAALLAKLGINITVAAAEEKNTNQIVQLNLLQNQADNLGGISGAARGTQRYPFLYAANEFSEPQQEGFQSNCEDSLLPNQQNPHPQPRGQDNDKVDEVFVQAAARRPSDILTPRVSTAKSEGVSNFFKKRSWEEMAPTESDESYQNIAKVPKFVVTPTRTPYSTVRARRRKAFFLRRRPVHPVK